jgi:ribosomal protein S18 acetylase RimI-like enzyme
MQEARSLTIVRADYGDSRDAADIVALLDAYARDPMGGGEPLTQDTRMRLVEGLAAVPGAFSLIARLDEEAVGLANCFTGFSTFAGRPLVNIHDIVVLPGSRGTGIGRALLSAVDDAARAIGACKVTLEVLSGNERAKALYASHGFGDFVLDPEAGTALFWQKKLDD